MLQLIWARYIRWCYILLSCVNRPKWLMLYQYQLSTHISLSNLHLIHNFKKSQTYVNIIAKQNIYINNLTHHLECSLGLKGKVYVQSIFKQKINHAFTAIIHLSQQLVKDQQLFHVISHLSTYCWHFRQDATYSAIIYWWHYYVASYLITNKNRYLSDLFLDSHLFHNKTAIEPYPLSAFHE